MLYDIISYSSLRPTNLEQNDSFSDHVKSKMRFVYIHSGVGTMGIGGLRQIAKAMAMIPKEIQPDIVDQVHIVESRMRLNFRLTKAKILSKLAKIGGAIGSSIMPLNGRMFTKIKYHASIFEFCKFFWMLQLRSNYENSEKQTVNNNLSSNLHILNRLISLLPSNVLEMLKKGTDKAMASISDNESPLSKSKRSHVNTFSHGEISSAKQSQIKDSIKKD